MDKPIAPPPIPCINILPVENSVELSKAGQIERIIFEMIRKGNLAQAEIILRGYHEKDFGNPSVLNFLGWIASAVNLPQFALEYFGRAVERAPTWKLPQTNLKLVEKYFADTQGKSGIGKASPDHTKKNEKFLLIKAWGYGFWSDVSHVLGQLLVAELAGRTPVVSWGRNSLFWDGATENAFDYYFEALSDVSVQDIQKSDFDFWPPKWNHGNLLEGEVNKWSGSYSRVASLYLLGRPEKVVVSDFFTSVYDLKPWIPRDSHLYGLSADELYLYFVRKYLHPKNDILDAVDAFYKLHLAEHDFIAVHARGSDKALEMNDLDEVNRQYKKIIDQHIASRNCQRIFLMTDDARILEYFKEAYGNKIVTTDCQRTNSATGIHYQTVPDRRRLGIEVMVDAYLAMQAKAFVGNGFSNPSLIVRYLKDWPACDVALIGQNMFHTPNTFLHNW